MECKWTVQQNARVVAGETPLSIKKELTYNREAGDIRGSSNKRKSGNKHVFRRYTTRRNSN